MEELFSKSEEERLVKVLGEADYIGGGVGARGTLTITFTTIGNMMTFHNALDGSKTEINDPL